VATAVAKAGLHAITIYAARVIEHSGFFRAHDARPSALRYRARMYRLLFLATGVLAGCGTIECDDQTYTCTGGENNLDDRPLTLEYVTVTVLRPSCANAQCHSSFAYTAEYRFDTVEHAQESLAGANGQLVVPGDSASSFLFQVLVRETQPDGSAPRMPYDQPLPTADIALIKQWIDDAMADGLVTQ
jgi:hypothetical protein